MNGLDPNLTPYLIAQAVAVGFLVTAWKSTRLARLLFVLLFVWASATNLYLGLTQPAIYGEYAAFAVPVYRDFITGWFSRYSYLMVPTIAIGQLLIGVGMLLRGGWVRLACVGAIVFLLSIAPLLVGSGFPFSLIVSWAVWLVLTNDHKDYLWKRPTGVLSRRSKPHQTTLRPATLTAVLAGNTAITSLFFSQLYRDNTFVETAWYANDWVTVFVSVTTIMTLFYAERNIKARLVLVGLLGYFVYNYAFYLFGAAFNVLFLLYVGVVALGLFSLIGLIISLPVSQFHTTSNRIRFIAAYLFLIALMLLLVEVPPIGAFLTTGALPEIVLKTAHPTSVVFALDLTLIMPTCLIAAVWLWQQKPWGVVLGAIMLVKGVAYGLVLSAGTLLLANRQIDTDPLLLFYVILVVGGLVGLTLLLRSLPVNKKGANGPRSEHARAPLHQPLSVR